MPKGIYLSEEVGFKTQNIDKKKTTKKDTKVKKEK